MSTPGAVAAATEPRFDPTGLAGPRDWADLYRRFQAFVMHPQQRQRRSSAPPPPDATAAATATAPPKAHRCSARDCVIYSCGDFHVCVATNNVHYCADVYTCDRRVSVREQGLIVCAVSGCARQTNRYDHFGYLLAYAEGGTVCTPSGAGRSGAKRRAAAAAGDVNDGDDDDDGGGGGGGRGAPRHMAAYKRARVCGRLPGVTQVMPRATRDAIMSGRGGRADGDVGDGDDVGAVDLADDVCSAPDDDADADASGVLGNLDDPVARAAGAAAVVASTPSRAPNGRLAADRAQRDAQADLEREADVAWLCGEFVRKDDGQTVARRQASREIRWRKVVHEHVADCVHANQPVYLMLLISFMTKQAADLDRWRVAYNLVPDACLPTLRAWAADRVNALWVRFRSQVRDKNASPLKYSYAYHTLAVLYCSATGITWANSTAWLLSPIPYLAVLLPSQKDLNNYTLGRHAKCARIEKGVFTRTSRMTRNWLVKLTQRGECATATIDAPHEAAMRAFPPCTYVAPTAAPDTSPS